MHDMQNLLPYTFKGKFNLKFLQFSSGAVRKMHLYMSLNVTYRGSYMSACVLLNLLNKLIS